MNGAGMYAKAILATMIAALGALGTALADERVTGAEWTGIIAAALVAGSVVWAVPNADLGGTESA